jgi:parallel beta-helix repeat protein
MGFSFRLLYDPEFLTYKGADANRSMLKARSIDYNFACTDGEVTLELIPGQYPVWKPQSGNGTLVTIEFYCHNTGDDVLALGPGSEGMGEWMLIGIVDSTYQKIPKNYDPSYTYNVTHIYRTVHLDRPQTYRLLEDVMNYTEYTLFSIDSNDVVLDLNSHTVNNTHEGVGWAYAISIKENHNNIIIKNGTITNFQYAVEMVRNEAKVEIFDLMILNMSETAIKVEGSTDIHIFNNNISSSLKETVLLSNCNLSTVSDNILSNDKGYGIHMIRSTNNTISCNQIMHNKQGGVYIQDSSNNTITCNQIMHNNPRGVYMEDSSNNTIFNNNFINNTDASGKTNHVISDAASINNWNCSYPHGGNYWDDWNATDRKIVDEKSGENHTIPGPDGIGDTSYFVKTNNQDWYPLMNPYNTALQVCDICRELQLKGKTIETKTLSVAVFTDSSVVGLNFNGTLKLISFNVSGECTSCKVIVSKELLDGAFEIKVGGIPVASFLNCEGDYVFANFTHPSGSHQVEVCGEIVRRCDLNSDDVINILDLALVAKEFDGSIKYTKSIEPQD